MCNEKKYIHQLIDCNRRFERLDDKIIISSETSYFKEVKNKINIIAMGDVGANVLLGMRLLGEDYIESIGIYDMNPAVLIRYEREMNQICFPDGRKLPSVEILSPDNIYDCDVLVFCATKGVPPVGSQGDMRMLQLDANSSLVIQYASDAAKAGFRGLFAVVSDPVDPLCKAAVLAGLDETQVQGFGLGVMNGRARYYAAKNIQFRQYIEWGRAFGPHGQDLVIADSIVQYSEKLSRELTELTVKSNIEIRDEGFKPYIAPAFASGALSILAVIRGEWNYSSIYLGHGGSGAFLGCRNRRTGALIEIEDLPLDNLLYDRIESAYRALERLI